MYKTRIEWCDGSWNPVTGCTRVSAGCDNCYAFALAERQRGTPAFPNGFDLTLRPHKLHDPDKWRKPRRVFVNSMSDVFHIDIPTYYVLEMFVVMNRNPCHQFQVLTKRPGLALRLADRITWTDNIWLGVSVEDERVLHRVSQLRRIPAAVRFLSCEPLLGPLGEALEPHLASGEIHWVVDGGESGPGRRPAEYDWFRGIRDACQRHGVAYLHKQGNAFVSGNDRQLDGRLWDEYPRPHPASRPEAARRSLPETPAAQAALAFG